MKRNPFTPVANAVMFVALLLFIFGLVYLSHNSWHF